MCVFLSSVSHIFLLTAFSVLTVILLSLMPDSLVLCLILCNSRLYPQFIPSPPLFSYRYAFFLFGHFSYISKSSSFLLWVLPGCPAWQSLSFPLQRCWGKSHQTHMFSLMPDNVLFFGASNFTPFPTIPSLTESSGIFCLQGHPTSTCIWWQFVYVVHRCFILYFPVCVENSPEA